MKCNNIIYGLIDPRDGELRYVGKSVRGLKRFYGKNTHRAYCSNWIKSLRNKGLNYEVIILEETNNLVEAERRLIKLFRTLGYKLTNMTDGGEGTVGFKMSEETKKKIGKKALGRKCSDLTKLKISKSKNGKPRSAETRSKISKSKIGKKRGVEFAEKMSAIAKKRGVEHLAVLNRRKILCIDDGLLFDSVSSAAKYYGLDTGTISRIAHGKSRRTLRLIYA
jgi:group I intron endonuclease